LTTHPKPRHGSEALAKRLIEELDKLQGTLQLVSSELFEHPELSGEEKRAASLLSDVLRRHGFQIEQSVGGLPTAFIAKCRLGTADSGPNVGLFCEYDALPGIGHACGHNLIAAASTVASIALCRALGGVLDGHVWVIGSPAEETFGGKITLLAANALDTLDAAMMFHPGPQTRVRSLTSMATEPTEIRFYQEDIPGKEHIAPPNPVHAMTTLFSALSMMAQRLDNRFHFSGVIVEAGERPNVIPRRSIGRFSFRAKDRPTLRILLKEVLQCVRGAARLAGCSFSICRYEPAFEPILVNQTIGKICERYLEQEGLKPNPSPPSTPGAYDIGNVSRRIPVIHPIISRGFDQINTHTDLFAKQAGSQEGLKCAKLGAKVLALTALSLFLDPNLVKTAQEELAAALKQA